MFPDKWNQETAEELANFCSGISQEYNPIRKDAIPTSYECQLPTLTVEEVSKLLRTCKKSQSRVSGDIFPELYNDYSSELVIPILNIFNQITVDKMSSK